MQKMTVKDAKRLVAIASNDELLTAYKRLKAQQRGAALTTLIRLCRVSDKLYSELRRRGIVPISPTS